MVHDLTRELYGYLSTWDWYDTNKCITRASFAPHGSGPTPVVLNVDVQRADYAFGVASTTYDSSTRTGGTNRWRDENNLLSNSTFFGWLWFEWFLSPALQVSTPCETSLGPSNSYRPCHQNSTKWKLYLLWSFVFAVSKVTFIPTLLDLPR